MCRNQIIEYSLSLNAIDCEPLTKTDIVILVS